MDDEPMSLRERWYWQKLNRHPDCRDPDHPGCQICREKDDDDIEDQE